VTSVVESTLVEVLVEQAAGVVVTSEPVGYVVETTASGPDILAEVTTTETLTDTLTETVYIVEPEIVLLDVGEQGPTGPQGPPGVGGTATSYPGRTIIYTDGVVSEVLSYLDYARTMLAERRLLHYEFGLVDIIYFYDGDGNLMKTRYPTYSSGILIGYIDV
jgi:hypothetical protein